MKAAFTTQTNKTDTNVDPKFGRAKYFCIMDTENGEMSFIANEAGDASRGAGVQAGQLMADQSVSAVISGHFGPNAYEVLVASKIEMFLYPEGEHINLDTACQLFKEGKLQKQ